MKVVISGYYGFGNAGDELILDAIITQIRSKEPGLNITVLSFQPEKTSSFYKVRSINRWNPFKSFWAIYRSDILISGGGGLFQDMTGSPSLYYYLLTILTAKLLRKKVFIYAVGINELKLINRFFTAFTLKLCDRITVRENYSFDMLVRWGVSQAKMDVTADPVLHREVPYVNAKRPQPKIAFVLRPPRTEVAASAGMFSKLCDSLSQRISAKIIFIPFHIEKDLGFTLSVMNSMRSTARLVQWNKPNDLYNIFSEIDMVVSQRLHGLILASLYRIPLVGISDDSKLERYLRELGQKNIAISAETNPYSLLAVIADVWEWRDEFIKNVSNILPSLQLRSKMTAEIFGNEINPAAKLK